MSAITCGGPKGPRISRLRVGRVGNTNADAGLTAQWTADVRCNNPAGGKNQNNDIEPRAITLDATVSQDNIRARGMVVRRWLTVEVSSEDVFAGEICGVGSTLGVRVVVGRWPVSPFGSVADAMVEDANGRRVFIAHDEGLAGYVSSIYSFDEVIVAPVDCERGQDRLRFRGGPLRLDVSVGHRDALGWALRTVPHRVATNETWVTFTDVLARVLLRGVRTRGVTPGGTELYAATDRHRVTAIDGCWYDRDLGELRDVDPPVRFGFSSTPRQPSIVEVTTIVRRSGG